MRNATSLFLTLITYLIMLGTVLALLFAAMPVSLRAQTNLPAETNLNSVVAATNSPAADTNRLQKNQRVQVGNTGIHVGGPEPVDIKWGNDFGGGPGLLVAVLTAFVLPVFIVVILPLAIISMVFYVGHRRNKMAHETLRAMIEKGVPITPEMVAQLGSRHIVGAPRQSGQSRRLLPGLVLIGVGAALLITGHGHLGAGGLILLFVGVAFLIVWLVERKNKNDAQPPQS